MKSTFKFASALILLCGTFILSSCSSDNEFEDNGLNLRSSGESTTLPKKYIGRWVYESPYGGKMYFEFTKYGTYSEFQGDSNVNGVDIASSYNYNFFNRSISVEDVLAWQPIVNNEIHQRTTWGAPEVYKKCTDELTNVLIGKWKLVSKDNVAPASVEYLEITDTKISESYVKPNGKVAYNYKNSKYDFGLTYVNINKAAVPFKTYTISADGKTLRVFKAEFTYYPQFSDICVYELVEE